MDYTHGTRESRMMAVVNEVAQLVRNNPQRFAGLYQPGVTLEDIARGQGLVPRYTLGVAAAGLRLALPVIMGEECYRKVAEDNQVRNGGGYASVLARGLVPYDPGEFRYAVELMQSDPGVYVHQTKPHKGKPNWIALVPAINREKHGGRDIRRPSAFKGAFNLWLLDLNKREL